VRAEYWHQAAAQAIKDFGRELPDGDLEEWSVAQREQAGYVRRRRVTGRHGEPSTPVWCEQYGCGPPRIARRAGTRHAAREADRHGADRRAAGVAIPRLGPPDGERGLHADNLDLRPAPDDPWEQ
jgi:hypothetical protein